MLTIGVYLLLIILPALPFESIIRWLYSLNQSPADLSFPATFPPSKFQQFCITTVLRVVVIFGSIVFTYQFFYYDNPTFFFVGISLIISSYLWSLFNTFNLSGSMFYFFLAFYCYFSWLFLLITPLLYIIFSFIFNHSVLRNIFVISTSFLSIFVFELKEFFLTSNGILLALFFIKHLAGLDNYFSKKPRTLIQDFNNRLTA